jgi:hypothetical protein
MAPARKPDGIFVDTGAFFAAVVRTDRHHLEAVSVHRRAMELGIPLVCSKWTVVETHSLLVLRAGRDVALAWLESVPAAVLPVASEDEERALRILRSHRDKAFTLVDASSFALMERLGLRVFHSYDRHFQQFGKFVAATAGLLRRL